LTDAKKNFTEADKFKENAER